MLGQECHPGCEVENSLNVGAGRVFTGEEAPVGVCSRARYLTAARCGLPVSTLPAVVVLKQSRRCYLTHMLQDLFQGFQTI